MGTAGRIGKMLVVGGAASSANARTGVDKGEHSILPPRAKEALRDSASIS